MSEVGELIKELALNAVEAEKPVDIVSGCVICTEPLKVRIEQRLVLEKNFIDVCVGAVYEVDSQVALLRYKGGQRYLLLDSII